MTLKVAIIYGFNEPANGGGGGLAFLGGRLRNLGYEVKTFAWNDRALFDEVFDFVIGHSYGGHQAIEYGNRLPGFVSGWILALDPVPQNYWFMPWRLKNFQAQHERMRCWLRHGPRLFPWPSKPIVYHAKWWLSVGMNRILPKGMTHNSMRASDAFHDELIEFITEKAARRAPQGSTQTGETNATDSNFGPSRNVDGSRRSIADSIPGAVAEPAGE